MPEELTEVSIPLTIQINVRFKMTYKVQKYINKIEGLSFLLYLCFQTQTGKQFISLLRKGDYDDFVGREGRFLMCYTIDS